MNFINFGHPLDDAGMDTTCNILGVSEPAVWAVLTVETRGFGFLQDKRPQMLFERHIFHRLSQGRHDTENEDISSPTPGGYRGGTGEYARLEKAMELNREAALKSASWGIAQVMGFNYSLAGFPSIDDMVTAMVEDENAQLAAMSNFIKQSNLAGALQRENWVSFARGYNGKDYKRNEYDTRLAAAHAKYSILFPDLELRAAQAALFYLGIDPGPIDGFRGRRTRSALIRFQELKGLRQSGELDEQTEGKLFSEIFPHRLSSSFNR